MIPQDNEPCKDCKKWDSQSADGCPRYNCASMVIFGYCSQHTPKDKDHGV